jgi:hypothetical protein
MANKRYTPKHMVMDLTNAFNSLKKEGVSLEFNYESSQENLTIYSKKITEKLVSILHEYGIRIQQDKGQTFDFNKNIEVMTFHEMIHALTVMIESRFMDQISQSLENGTIQKIYEKLLYLNHNRFAFQDDLLFNYYQQSLNQIANVIPLDETIEKALKRLQKIVRKQRSRKPIMNEEDFYVCPSCISRLCESKQRFCQQCGQKLSY